MVQKFERVQPGDLITAQVINSMLLVIESLDVRVAAIETGQKKPFIETLSPSYTIHLGDELHIIGRNFGLPSSNVVQLDGKGVGAFKSGSNDTLLIIIVPTTIEAVPPEGKLVMLTVSNPNGFASTMLTVLPTAQTIPFGDLFVIYSQAPAVQKLEPPNGYTFLFTITAITNMDETFVLAPSVEAGWPVTVVDSGDNVISPEIMIPKGPPSGTVVNVRVRVVIPQGTAVGTSTRLKLKITSKRNPQLNRSSKSIILSVGSAPPAPQDKIMITFSNVISPQGQPKGDYTDGVLVIPAVSQDYGVSFRAILKEAGSYKVEVPAIADNKWGAALVSDADLPNKPANAEELIELTLSAKPGASPNKLIIRLKMDRPSNPVVEQFEQDIKT